MDMRGLLRLLPLLALCGSAAAGEIIFVDPAREKAAQAPRPAPPNGPTRAERLLDQTLDDARLRSGRSLPPRIIEESDLPPAGERAAEARDYQRGVKPVEETTVILQAAPPPSEAGKAREKARAWVSPPAAGATAAKRCVTQNTVGGIEGQQEGRGTTVIQSTASGVIAVCK